ncbi:hypothetical protein [Halorubrum aethiopicum]|uniref:hypothetical protein n=1 Tax=Halorubrum aethiopicum TaxID=1758255 RepID=UPI000AFC8215|nr:hypothetical protein [Halorubrum aethiopicum]
MDGFAPNDVDTSLDEIIPTSKPNVDFDAAKAECTAAVEELSADVSGIGPKAAERYLLRYEFGFSTKELAEQYGVTSPAITKHTRSVREMVLKYPRLARIIGQFRAERADLIDPTIDDHLLWEGQFETDSTEANAQVAFHVGDFHVPYSWMYSLTAEAQDGDTVRHLLVYYIVDADCGVFLKRSLRGVSHTSWRRTPHYQRQWNYTVYPLPHPEIPNEDGTLIEAVEHHVPYDVKKAYDEVDWQVLEMYAKSNIDVERPSASFSLPDVLLDHIRQENSINSVFDYSEEVHKRHNIEHLLRLYPLTQLSQIPLETVTLLWNGPLTPPESMESTTKVLKTALEASKISINPGHRNI